MLREILLLKLLLNSLLQLLVPAIRKLLKNRPQILKLLRTKMSPQSFLVCRVFFKARYMFVLLFYTLCNQLSPGFLPERLWVVAI